jgi:hypothetical protein
MLNTISTTIMSTTNAYYVYSIIWVNYNDLTATSLGMMVSRGDYPQMTLFQVSELL